MTARRLPLTPLRLEFSTLAGSSYVAHGLDLPLRVRPEPPPSADGATPPAVLLRFHPVPAVVPPPAGVQTRAAGGLLAVLGLAAGGALAHLARRREFRRSPAGIRRAALDRLHRRHLEPQHLQSVYDDLRLCLGLPGSASVAEMEAALRPVHPDLAAELQAVELRRFAPAGSTGLDTRRLADLLRRLSILPLLTASALTLWALPPPADAEMVNAADAFRRRDVAAVCLALEHRRRTSGESPELLMSLANASWFSGRRVEALALYERAARLAPRRQDVRTGLTWLRAAVLSGTPGTRSVYPLPWRDRLLPDEWLFLAGLLTGLAGVGAGCLRWRGLPVRYLAGASALLVFLCLSCAASQWAGPYRQGATARLTEAVGFLSAPAAEAEPLGVDLPAGTLVIPRDAVGAWLRVRTLTAEGWVQASRCALVW